MVGRGGWLDEILWVVNTEEEDDLRYLEETIASDPGRHKALYLPGETLSTYTYYKAWQRLDRGKYYVKVDDDIVRLRLPSLPHPHRLQDARNGRPANPRPPAFSYDDRCGSPTTQYLDSSAKNSTTRNALLFQPTSSTTHLSALFITTSAPFTPTFRRLQDPRVTSAPRRGSRL